MLLSEPLRVAKTLQRVHLIHVGLTLVLFFANIIATQLISTDKFIGRLKYVGHEMAFLGCGIELARLFTAANSETREVILAVLFLYVSVWVLTLLITKRVLSNAPIMLTPLIGATLLLGVSSVGCAVSGIVDARVIEFLTR